MLQNKRGSLIVFARNLRIAYVSDCTDIEVGGWVRLVTALCFTGVLHRCGVVVATKLPSLGEVSTMAMEFTAATMYSSLYTYRPKRLRQRLPWDFKYKSSPRTILISPSSTCPDSRDTARSGSTTSGEICHCLVAVGGGGASGVAVTPQQCVHNSIVL